jgi:CRP/FNR family transcriptional regulator, cyclic AMP receptor protein
MTAALHDLRPNKHTKFQTLKRGDEAMSDRNLIDTLKQIDFLQDIDPVHLEQIASIAEIREFDAHDVLFHEGDPADYVYFVVAGKLTLESCPSTIYQKSLMSVGPGEMLGWSAFVKQRNYASTGVISVPTQLVRIEGKHLRAICDRDPQFGYEFMQRIMEALAKRLRTTWSQLANIYIHRNLPTTACVGE